GGSSSSDIPAVPAAVHPSNPRAVLECRPVLVGSRPRIAPISAARCIALAHPAFVHLGARLAQREGFIDAILQKLDPPRTPANLGRDHSFDDGGLQLFYAR